MKQLVNEIISDKRSLPYNVAGTGTLSTRGIAINGLGTLFSTELKAGSYLVNLPTNEAIRVYRMDSNTVAFLEKPFAADMTAVTPQIIPAHVANPKLISISSTGAIEVNGKAFDGTMSMEKTGNDRSSRRDLIEPVVIDATANATQIEILY